MPTTSRRYPIARTGRGQGVTTDSKNSANIDPKNHRGTEDTEERRQELDGMNGMNRIGSNLVDLVHPVSFFGLLSVSSVPLWLIHAHDFPLQLAAGHMHFALRVDVHVHLEPHAEVGQVNPRLDREA